MKKLYCIALFLFSVSLFAQNPIDNPGFENWTAGEPDNWVTNNAAIPGAVTQSNDANSGSFAAKGESKDFGGFPFSPVINALGDGTQFIPISQNYAALTGYYKFESVGGDMMIVSASILTAENLLLGATDPGASLPPVDTYTPFTLPITYVNTGTAAKATVSVTMLNSGGLVNLGSFFLIDDFDFTTNVGVEPVENQPFPESFSLEQNYPNPFNPSTTIRFTIPEASQVRLTIYNQLGQTVDVLVDEALSAGTYTSDWQAADLPSGLYYYRIEAGDFRASKKMILMR